MQSEDYICSAWNKMDLKVTTVRQQSTGSELFRHHQHDNEQPMGSADKKCL